ncbi:MAG: serine/threonine protein kinase [Deltaproteobacteria bacterium]|nr:serine/threonine protein kinase [Deltaproteobacteria bacterium]
MSTPGTAPRYRMVGRYAISDEIAAGGMASVHLGRLVGPVAFTRTVAIKRMHAHLVDDEEMRARFLDEARLAARIRHPNVVPTLDIIAADDEVFIVMEYVHGTSLGRLVAAAREAGLHVPARVVTTILAEALHGLHAAHEAKSDQGEPLQLVHRDVSPQNILIGADGTTRVVDFGIAKARARKFQTSDGKLRGKLKYMAPEQLRGGSVDRRTDVYSAGVVLWECLTGQRLHEGASEVELIAKLVATTRPTPPSSVRACPTLTPEQVECADMITVRALATEPKDRYPTALAMAMAIENNLPLATRVEVVGWLESLVGPSMEAWTKKVEAFEREPIDQASMAATLIDRGPPAMFARLEDTAPISTLDDPPASLTRTSGHGPLAPAGAPTTSPPAPLLVAPPAIVLSAPPAAPSEVPAPPPAPPAPRRRSYALLAAFLGTVVIAIGGAAIAKAVRSSPKEASASTPAAPPTSAVSSAPSSPPMLATAPPTPEPIDSNFPREPLPGRRQPGRHRAAGGGSRSTDRAAAPSANIEPAPPPSPPDCDPPYTRDPVTGVIMHKPHCLGRP